MSAGPGRSVRRSSGPAADAGGVGRFARAALGATQVVYLGMLWLSACLPLVTIPAASVALVARLRAWRTAGQEPSARALLGEMRTAFGRRTLTMLLATGIGLVLVLDMRAIGMVVSSARPVALTLWFAFSLAMGMLLAFVPAVLATDDVGPVDALGRSARAAVLHPALALSAVGATAVAAVVALSVPLCTPLLAVATAWVLDRLSARAFTSPTEIRNPTT